MKPKVLLTTIIVPVFLLAGIKTTRAQYPDTFIANFDSPDTTLYIIADSTSGDWQVGAPQKAFFGSAPSLPNAIMTDTVNPFTPDTISSFILEFPNIDTLNNFPFYTRKICFDHKLQTEVDSDFAQVAISPNHGYNWYDYNNDPEGWELTDGGGQVTYTDSFYTNYHYLNDSLYGLSGVTEEYQNTCINICWVIPIIHEGNLRTYPPDSIWVKFTFIAGSNTAQNAGWIIDNVTYDYYFCGYGIAEHNLPPLEVYPQPAHSTLHFYKPENTSAKAVLNIYDAVGRCIETIPYQNNSLEINIENRSNGLYTYVLTDKGSPVNVGKFIISH